LEWTQILAAPVPDEDDAAAASKDAGLFASKARQALTLAQKL
jgi:hypothetical protein